MSQTYPVSDAFAKSSHLTESEYFEMYQRSLTEPEQFWREQANRIDWIKPFTKVSDYSFSKKDLHINWYSDGSLNVCFNCVDRHLADKADQPAIIWEGDNPDNSITVSYRELHREVCKFANVLKKLGVEKGDRVTLYMPMILEASYAMLACARIGAIHSVVFGGFSADALAGRIIDCKSKLVITADFSHRGGKDIPLKKNVDDAAGKPGVKDYLESVLVIKNADQIGRAHV